MKLNFLRHHGDKDIDDSFANWVSIFIFTSYFLY